MISHDIADRVQRVDAPHPGTLRVMMVADLVCPWCYLGKRRLDTALTAVEGPTSLQWHPFQLNPEMPADGMDFEEYVARKFGDRRAVQAGLDELTRTGRAEGIHFRFDRLTRIPNTLDAHRLMRCAETEGADTSRVAEGLLRGFFEDGLDLADRDVLVDVGGRNGLTRPGILRTFEDDTTRRIVLSQESQMRHGGVTGVPDFLINDRLLVIGAQPVETLVDAFDRAMFGEESGLPISESIH